MRLRPRHALPVALAGLLLGCGAYTNIPAQIDIASITPGSAAVRYAANGGGTTTDTPVVTLVGEPGSIGVTYSTAVIHYYTNGLSAPQELTQLGQSMDVSVRVPSSAMPTSNGGVATGSVSWTPPIVTTPVITYGQNGSAPSISADVTLQGLDDAHFPATLHFNIPIYFQTGT